MSTDSDATNQVKRGSEVIFYSFVALVALGTFAGAVYFLDGTAEEAPSAAGANRSLDSSRPAAADRGATKKAAVAVVEKQFRLFTAGEHRAACALESPAYLRFDAGQYSQGSCEAASRALSRTVASRGISIRLISPKVVSFGNGKATVLAKTGVGDQVVDAHFYLTYHGGRWWISGADDSGDLGY